VLARRDLEGPMGQPMCCGKAYEMVQVLGGNPSQPLFSGAPGFGPAAPTRGLTVWVDSVDELVTALSIEPTPGKETDLEHLYMLPEGGGDAAGSSSRPAIEELWFPRDVGLQCGVPFPGGMRIPWALVSNEGKDSYACVQVDDMANPWGLYAICEGHGPDGGRASAQFAAQLPGILARNPHLHRSPCRALFESHLSGSQALGIEALSQPTLSIALLRDEFLNIAWAGDAKMVLGRLAAKAGEKKPTGATPSYDQLGTLKPASRPRRGKRPQEGYMGAQNMKQWIHFDGPPPILRAVDLTAQSPSEGWGSQADIGAGTPARHDKPEVRRMRLKSDDVCVIIGTSALWNCLSPEEVVTIVGQNMHRMASDAAAALAAEVQRRASVQPGAIPETEASQGGSMHSEFAGCSTLHSARQRELELTVIVVYLAGERYVKDFDVDRASHLEGQRYVSEGLMKAGDTRGFDPAMGCFPGCSPLPDLQHPASSRTDYPISEYQN